MSDVEAVLQLDKARASRRKIPSGLTFDKLVKNQTASPCSLNDFMDYLVYVEHNAEVLQFFLWYCEYIRRWSHLEPKQKELSPVWDAEKARKKPRSRYITYSHKRAKGEKMNKIITIMELADQNKRRKNSEASELSLHSRDGSSTTSVPSRRPSTASTSSTATASSSYSDEENWPLTQQPFRDEVDQIATHYLSGSGPRRLNLTRQDRENCLNALKQTTHPSALLPAFVVAEANLKGQSHPNFIHWSMTNSNKPHLIFLRVFGILLILFGLGLDALLILSKLPNYFRFLSILLLWPGFSILVSAACGVCIFLYLRNLRDLRPWEQFGDQEHTTTPADDPELGLPAPALLKGEAGPGEESIIPAGGIPRRGSASSTFSRVDPLRKSSLQTFGPANDYRAEPWVKCYAGKPVWRKMFETAAPVQNRSLRRLHGQTVSLAVVWGALVSTVIAAGSLFIPSGNLF